MFNRLTAMDESNPLYVAPTELHRYLNIYGYKYSAPTELLPEHAPTPNAKRQTDPYTKVYWIVAALLPLFLSGNPQDDFDR
jgi:hypothetical protein